jgi:proteasome alpha subunit
MYEEPYRWVEAVGNRRTYLDEQFKQGSPVVGISYEDGILLTTVSKGTPKLYEIYDRMALGGMGHPADLEKLRFSLLEMAHVEGFNRSPSDVTGSRLVKYGIAPLIKQAFEEVFKAPFIVRILLAELGQKPEKDSLLTINYDGSFEETRGTAVLAATSSAQKRMLDYLQKHASSTRGLDRAVTLALQTWALGSLVHRQEADEEKSEQKPGGRPETTSKAFPEETALTAYLRDVLSDKTIECAVLDRRQAGSSKYRTLKAPELTRLLPKDFQPAVAN